MTVCPHRHESPLPKHCPDLHTPAPFHVQLHTLLATIPVTNTHFYITSPPPPLVTPFITTAWHYGIVSQPFVV